MLPYLQRGDKIGIVSTARKMTKEELSPAIKAIESYGFQVVTANNLFSEHHQFSGSDDERAADLQQMLDDDSIKAVLCARGGYGTVRIIDKIDFSRFVRKPKWIAGFSDVTVLHSHIHTNFGIETLHSAMPLTFPNNSKEAIDSLFNALSGKPISYTFKSGALSRKGEAKGQLVGGNLSILYSLSGTSSDINTKGKVLFIEDLDEYLYHIDRMMMNLKRVGKLESLAALIVGGMTDMNDNQVPFGKTAKEIVLEAVKEYDFPVVFDFPAGHINDNRSLILGREVELNIRRDEACLVY